MHSYPLQLKWSGSTAAEYARDASGSAEGKPTIDVSSAPEYAGNAGRWNPEDLLGLSLATCHMLTFLALARKARIDVRSYEDRATAVLDTVDGVTYVTRIELRPTIKIASGDIENTKTLFEKAHKYCFIANSIRSTVDLHPTIELIEP